MSGNCWRTPFRTQNLAQNLVLKWVPGATAATWRPGTVGKAHPWTCVSLLVGPPSPCPAASLQALRFRPPCVRPLAFLRRELWEFDDNVKGASTHASWKWFKEAVQRRMLSQVRNTIVYSAG